MSEYNNSMSNGNSCSYSNLCNYNGASEMVNNLRNAKPVKGVYVVPAYNAISYDALTLKANGGGCGSYGTIISAYGANADSCNQQYLSRACGGCNK
jgi:hypothetical protein